MARKILIVVILLIVAVVAIGMYLYFKPVASLKNQKPDIEVSAEKIFSDFSTNEENANSVYFNKTINVGGVVSQIQNNNDASITLFLATTDAMGSVTCKMEKQENERIKKLVPGEVVSVNGKCTGYLMDVVLVNCSLIEK